MKMTYPLTAPAARVVADRYRETWQKIRAQLDRDVAGAVRDKSYLADNHWVNEHRAHGLYQSALALAEILEEGEIG